jgi:hypothetical protein
MTETSTAAGNGNTQLPVPPDLPGTRTALLAQYKLKKKRTINDLVEEVIVRLWESEDFQRYLYPIYDSQAVEKSLEIDNVMMAIMIRNEAKKADNHEVAGQPLDTIERAMKVALRRFDVDRRTRAEQAELPLAPPAPAPAAE